jgi:Raf kinase inhibitor-like YbhB/YbcL family protein
MKATSIATLKITSSAFKDHGMIPVIYSCEGSSINPPLQIENIPDEAESLAIIVEDPDAPKGVVTHWIAWNISPQPLIEENAALTGIQGLNERGMPRYMGPCPPDGTHRYFFKIYALDAKLNLSATSKKADLEKTMDGHILAFGELIGLYKKQ